MVISTTGEKLSGNTLALSAVEIVPVSAATAAPVAKLISFSQFTGIPITSAASGSSRSDRQARPVRERFTKRSATKTTRKTAERDVVVRDREDALVLQRSASGRRS